MNRSMVSRFLKWSVAASIAAAPIAGGAVGFFVYRRRIERAYQRVRSRGSVVRWPGGDIEYTEGGSGPDVLVIHGSGGGYDQGELMVQAVLGDQFHWISPSRFGYLCSTLPEGATWDDQAHAYAHLLDHLGVKSVAVVALSQGGPSALLFTLLHPDRVSSLTLISCGVAPSATEDQAEANKRGKALKTIFQSDLSYWTIATLFKVQLMSLMGADEAVIAALTPEQRRMVELVIDYMNPVSLRSAGVVFDNEATLPGSRIAAIEAPTLVIHARDDTLQLYHNAEFAASTISGARLIRFERGGHLVMVVEQTAIQTSLRQHIFDHLREGSLPLS